MDRTKNLLSLPATVQGGVCAPFCNQICTCSFDKNLDIFNTSSFGGRPSWFGSLSDCVTAGRLSWFGSLGDCVTARFVFQLGSHVHNKGFVFSLTLLFPLIWSQIL